MKIAVISLNLVLESGNPRLALSLARTYGTLGNEVTVYTTEFDPKCFPELNKGLDIRVIRPAGASAGAGSGVGFFSKAYKRIRKIIFNDRAIIEIAAHLPKDLDLLSCQNDDSYKVGLYYKKINPRAKVVWIMYNPPFFHSPKKNLVLTMGSTFLAWWERHTVQRHSKGIDLVVTDDEGKRDSVRSFGLPVISMPIPVDFDNFYAPVKNNIDKAHTVTLLGVGGLSPTRRFEDIISAVAILRDGGYDVKARIICKDYWRNPEYRRKFIQFLKDSGVEDRIDVHFDGADEGAFLSFLKNSSFFIFPSNVKIFGMTVFEAMAAGVPVVVSRATSVIEFLQDGQNALFIDPLRPDEIATSVRKLIDDPSLYNEFAHNGQQYVKENFRWANYARKIMDSIPN